ncbi:MAG: SDR family oxidoreductase [Methylococcaceae bacterium]|nr:SDR family oxidoreductase [Methylococcaceae bacterium]MDD1616134.1 SDR family oxidoreductase [Methylococcaceae bacterium]OYV18508.1 MAG: short-chain dehydrogenase [Methylococcaceae bacterium NSP1-2]
MPSILITGANRGLGLEFCRQYGEQGWRVFACCRQPDTAIELQALAKQWAHLTIHALEVSNFQQIDQLAAQLVSEPLDVLLSNAGVYGDKKDHDFGALDYAAWQETLLINTLAPVKLAEAFLPNLLKTQHPQFVVISSLMGSIADNDSGGSILYRSSKAGLNAALKSLAIDLQPQNIAVLILHPGWVKTDMGGERAPTSPEESIAGMRRVISEFTLEQSGSFFNYKGDLLPW